MDKSKICIIGLGYVGLPLAVEFSKKYKTHGFDTSENRIQDLLSGVDSTGEISKKELKEILNKETLKLTSKKNQIPNCDFYIITVPTPINEFNQPDMSLLFAASKFVGSLLKKNNIVIFESTVYPGATEEECVPILEKESNLKLNKDFFCGYSPERINPGDKLHTLTKIKKVVSGSSEEATDKINKLYNSIIKAGTHIAPSIKVAEAAKVIENTQRDINIAFVNELSLIFDHLEINTKDVLDAAKTKWNFLEFTPGLVGGHCIGVDPYYLTYKAQTCGYEPEIILAGRRLNDNMSFHVANKVINLINKKKNDIKEAKVLVLGVTFKENCPDIRNSKVFDLVSVLKKKGIKVDLHDPLADEKEVFKHYGESLIERSSLYLKNYEAVILAVPHEIFYKIDFESYKEDVLIFDLKGKLDFSHGSL